jgi:hypothetical protein
MSFSNFWENEILDHVFGTGAYTAPTNIYIALCTSTVLDSSTGGSLPGEVTGGAYARVVCNTWDAAAAGATENTQAESFAQATASWGTITHFALCDHSSTGNMLAHSALSTARNVASGDTARFATGDLDVTLT